MQELTSVGHTDPDRLRNYVASLHSKGLEVSIASTQNLIINSSNPKIDRRRAGIPRSKPPSDRRAVAMRRRSAGQAPAGSGRESTVYLIPVQVEDHLLGYVQVVANFGDFAKPLAQSRIRLH